MSDPSKFDLDDIPDPPPLSEPDQLSEKEEFSLSAGKHQKLTQRKFVEDLRRQVTRLEGHEDTLQRKVDSLHACEVELARFQTKDRMLQVVVIICTAAIAGGSFMTTRDPDWIRNAGYCLTVLGLLIQVTIGLFNIHRSD